MSLFCEDPVDARDHVTRVRHAVRIGSAHRDERSRRGDARIIGRRARSDTGHHRAVALAVADGVRVGGREVDARHHPVTEVGGLRGIDSAVDDRDRRRLSPRGGRGIPERCDVGGIPPHLAVLVVRGLDLDVRGDRRDVLHTRKPEDQLARDRRGDARDDLVLAMNGHACLPHIGSDRRGARRSAALDDHLEHLVRLGLGRLEQAVRHCCHRRFPARAG